jgi:hypothetical protein
MMEPSQFDSITRLFASRRLSRRSAILTGAGIGALGVVGANAQATPEAVTDQAMPEAGTKQGVPYMFVQTFGAGSIDAATDGVEMLLLVADHVAGQTLYFSDRPERIVGMVPTEKLIGVEGENSGIGFTPENPPNAALVLPDNKILVVELIDPSYDPATGQIRYQLRVLDDVSQMDLKLETEPLTAADAVGDFTAASLFIDDCDNGEVTCYASDGVTVIGTFGGDGNMGFCWQGLAACCAPCEAPGNGDWSGTCNATFSGCDGACKYGFSSGNFTCGG